jgi:putative SOS response-associated peptidase YedK
MFDTRNATLRLPLGPAPRRSYVAPCVAASAPLLDPAAPTPNFPPSWNAAPADLLPVVYDRRAGERSLDLLRWGLIPHWAKDINVGFANINAKAEAGGPSGRVFCW